MQWTERRARYRAILEGDTCIRPASVYDAISGRIAEDLGFELGMFAGSIASLAVLGAPDIIVLTQTEFAEQLRRINRGLTTMPVMVDADHGYGNAMNVMRTVQELETVGVAGMTIEDTDLPRAYGGGDTRPIPIEEGVGKMKAALAARSDPAVAVIGRTSAVSVTGAEDAAVRARAYAAAGVDAVFLAGVKTKDELAVVADAVTVPLVLGSTPPDLGSEDELAAAGVRVALQGHLPFMMAVRAVRDTLKALKEGTPPGDISPGADAELMKQVTRDDDYQRWFKEFMGS